MLFEPKLLTIFILMAAYAGLLVWLLSLANIWTPALIAETFFWFFGPAIVLYSQFDKAGRDPHFFRRTALAALTVTVVIEFVINLYPMNLIVELLLVPVLALIGGMLALTTEPEHRQVKGLLEFLLAVHW
jgi:peptidoglycan/LPS O-acetylase OafA/YrhL